MLKRALLLLTGLVHGLAALGFQDPLNEPADVSALAPRAPLTAMAHANGRMVAVGQRGIVVYAQATSTHLSWRQAAVPVSADLTGVAFGSALEGWAVGHGALVLHSRDGGASWTRQADGKMLGEAALAHYESSSDKLPAQRRQAVLDQARRLAQEKETQPLLDVWFKDAKTGYVVGTFNRIFRTDDGGTHWVPLIDKTDNPEELHFYGVRGLGDVVYLAGERGMVWRWDKSSGRFVAVPTPYSGSLFGLVVTPRAVLAYGMRGSVLRSTDQGAHWQRIETGLRAGIVAGDVRANGDIVLVAQSGDAVASSDDGRSFQRLSLSRRDMAAGVLAGPDGTLVLVGPTGARVEAPDRIRTASSPR